MVYILLAKGFEEIEALAPVDLLRRVDIDIATLRDKKTSEQLRHTLT